MLILACKLTGGAVVDPFVFIPIALYLVFTGLFLQQGLMNLFIGRTDQVGRRRFVVPFIFASAAFCLSLLWVLVAPLLGASTDQVRWSFFTVWLVAPVVGFFYTMTLAEHLGIEHRRVRYIYGFSLLQFIATFGMGLYTFATGVPLLFSYETGDFQSRIDQHLGGVFSPNWVTALMVGLTTIVVMSATAFFVREMISRKSKDYILISGILLTAVAIIVEQVGYLLQWSLIFSLMPLANSIEVIRITYLQTLAAGRRIEQEKVLIRRDQLQIKDHLTAISHDVNTPLGSLKLGIGALQSKNIDEQLRTTLTKELEYLHIVCANLMTLFQLELSTLNRTQRNVELSRTLNAVIPKYERLADELNVQLVMEDEHQHIAVDCDPSILEQSLGNLVYNAIIHAESRVTVTACVEGEMAVIRLVDDGKPVPAFAMHDLSDRSYRSFLEQEMGCPGWGLGVTIGNTFAKLQKGQLKITTLADGRTNVSLEMKI